MDDFESINDPIYYDKEGSYITLGQLRFFLNRPEGRKYFLEGDPVFVEYFISCGSYNIISDLMEEDSSCASMYWDEKAGSVGFSFPPKGRVARKFAKLGILEL
jgi:hypothetical protein